MGQYNKAVLTTAGENLIAQALAGEIQLNITKVKTSNYAYPNSTDFKSLTDMQGVKQTVSDPVTAVYSDTMIQTRALFSNEEIASTYYIHNIGLYAMDGTQEVLFCIVTAETPDEMPQYNGVASTSYIYNIQNVVQDAAELNITVNPSGTATIQDVLERVDSTGGDISETIIETLEATEEKYPIPAVGETVSVFAGKIQAFFENTKPLETDTSYYVATTGSDTTGDGSISSPYASITKALSVVPKDLGGYTVTINVADGTYNEDITISGFNNGYLTLRRQGDLELNSLCNVNKITVNYCDSVSVGSFNLTSENTESVYVNRCKFVLVNFCQSIASAPSSPSFSFDYTPVVRITGCRSLNHSICLRAFESYIYSADWSSDSIGDLYGIQSGGGGKVSKGNLFQPMGMSNNEYYLNSSIIVSAFGANIGTLRYDLTIYVATTGSDTTGDGTSDKPFATIQYAVDIIPKDLGGRTANVIIADGTYNETVYIFGYYGGIINIQSSNIDSLSTVCKISGIYIKDCAARVQLWGLYLTRTDGPSFLATSCTMVYVKACQAIETAASQYGFDIVYSRAYLVGCKVQNRSIGLRSYSSDVSSQNWDSSSTGNAYGIAADTGTIRQYGTQPYGTSKDKYQTNGGVITNYNGTQISDIISSGLSCTWGTITGGYIRHGNAAGGAAMITICVQVVTTVALSASTEYTISGFPSSNTPTDLAVASNSAPTTHSWFRHSSGQIVMVLTTALGVGGIKQFNITYLTNS